MHSPSQPSPAPLHEQFYRRLRHALVVGALHPGRDMSLRGLAAQFGVGVTPVREAVRRLAAEGALEIGSTRRIRVPLMDAALFEELMRARLLLEPECAAHALPGIGAGRLDVIRSHDASLNRSLADHDAQGYMLANHEFHFAIYGAIASSVFTPLVESLWLRIGPFMRAVYVHVGTANLVDQHARAIDAIERRDPTALRAAIEADIADGMRLLGHAILHDVPSSARLTKRGHLAERDHTAASQSGSARTCAGGPVHRSSAPS